MPLRRHLLIGQSNNDSKASGSCPSSLCTAGPAESGNNRLEILRRYLIRHFRWTSKHQRCSAIRTMTDTSSHCSRCDRYFVNCTAFFQHCRYSDRHWVCDNDWCNYDASTWLHLAEHCEDHEHGFVCWGCRTIFGNEQDFRTHIEEDNVCEECSRHFDTPNDLIMVGGNASSGLSTGLTMVTARAHPSESGHRMLPVRRRSPLHDVQRHDYPSGGRQLLKSGGSHRA